MANVSINVKNLKDYQVKVLRAHNELRNFEERFLNTLALMVMTRAMKNTPVRTGRLRRSYKVTKVETKGNDLTITIYNDARDNGADESYASYVEYGHFTRGRVSYVNGVRMLTMATDEVKAEMYRVWDKLFNEWAKEMGL